MVKIIIEAIIKIIIEIIIKMDKIITIETTIIIEITTKMDKIIIEIIIIKIGTILEETTDLDRNRLMKKEQRKTSKI